MCSQPRRERQPMCRARSAPVAVMALKREAASIRGGVVVETKRFTDDLDVGTELKSDRTACSSWPISPATKSIDTLRGYVRMRRCFRIILVRACSKPLLINADATQCPLYPQKRTCAVQLGMSAKCQ